jgi:predicted amidohydrolase
MMKAGKLASVLLAVITGSALAQQRPQDRNLHDANLSPGKVTQIVFSPDGTKLAASYYRSPQMRTLTDWAAWVAEWDLNTGQRTILRNAVGPITFADDGQTLTMWFYTREEHRRERWPNGKMAVWQFGAQEPTRMIVPGEKSSGRRNWRAYASTPLEEPVLSPDGRVRAVADGRAIIRLFDAATGDLIKTLRLDDRPTDAVCVAVVQFPSKFGRPKENRERLKMPVERAAERGAQIVVLPETAVTGYLSPDLETTWQVDQREISVGLTGANPADVAETVPGPSTEFFAPVADSWNIYLTVPLLEVDRATGKYYNTSVLLGPEGDVLLHYRKRNPWMWAERGWATPGDLGNPTVDTPYGRLGLLICYDIHEQAQIMADKGVDLLLYSIAWVEDEGDNWLTRELPGIARKHGFHIAGANWSLPTSSGRVDWWGYGHSMIIDSSGQVLARARGSRGSEKVFAEVPLPKRKDPAPGAPDGRQAPAGGDASSSALPRP